MGTYTKPEGREFHGYSRYPNLKPKTLNEYSSDGGTAGTQASSGTQNDAANEEKSGVFIIYHTKDQHAKELLVAQSKNENMDLEFKNKSLDKPFKNKWKTRIKPKIESAATSVVVVGKETHKREAVKWEIEQSRKAGNKIVAVQIHKNKHHRLPPGIKKSEEMKKWKVKRLNKKIKEGEERGSD